MAEQTQTSAATRQCPSEFCCGGYYPVARMSDEPEKCFVCQGTGEVPAQDEVRS